MIHLYGTYTSPFVRRVRYVLMNVGLDFELIDTSNEEGQKLLRQKTPIWKIPYIEWDGFGVWDSHSIIEYIFEKKGYGTIYKIPDSDKWKSANILHAIDAAQESGIQLFYMAREGAKEDMYPYLQKQKARIHSIFEWLKSQLYGNYLRMEMHFTILELALYTTLDWFYFRKVYPIENENVWMEFLEYHSKDVHLKNTAPY